VHGPDPGLQVAVHCGERELLLVHVGDEVRHARRRLDGVVRQIAPEADRVRLDSAASFVLSAVGATAHRKAGRERAGKECAEQRQDTIAHRVMLPS